MAVVWAPTCAACAQPLAEPLRGCVCAACWRRIARIDPPVCARCGTAIAGWAAATATCAGCVRSGGPATPRRAVGLHDGALREIVHAMKYGGRRTLASPLARLMRVAGEAWLAETDLVVPVPLHPRRRWRRGFNQAADLASHLGVPLVDALRRTRHTRPQAVLGRDERLRAVRGAFALRGSRGRSHPGRAVRGRRIIVVDDVVTTGATIEACAAVLVDAGARDVRALAVALAARGAGEAGPRSAPGR